MEPKTIIFNHGDKALNVSSFNLSQKKRFKKYQNRMKNYRFMPIRRFAIIWPKFAQKCLEA